VILLREPSIRTTVRRKKGEARDEDEKDNAENMEENLRAVRRKYHEKKEETNDDEDEDDEDDEATKAATNDDDTSDDDDENQRTKDFGGGAFSTADLDCALRELGVEVSR
jgi:hypothetical protein